MKIARRSIGNVQSMWREEIEAPSSSLDQFEKLAVSAKFSATWHRAGFNKGAVESGHAYYGAD